MKPLRITPACADSPFSKHLLCPLFWNFFFLTQHHSLCFFMSLVILQMLLDLKNPFITSPPHPLSVNPVKPEHLLKWMQMKTYFYPVPKRHMCGLATRTNRPTRNKIPYLQSQCQHLPGGLCLPKVEDSALDSAVPALPQHEWATIITQQCLSLSVLRRPEVQALTPSSSCSLQSLSIQGGGQCW